MLNVNQAIEVNHQDLKALFAPMSVVSLPVWQNGNIFTVNSALFTPSTDPN
jgi:hypothetical protein